MYFNICTLSFRISGQCSHVLAVIVTLEEWKVGGYKDVPAQPSSTSLPQQWDKPRGAKIKAEPVSQMIISRPVNMNRKRKPVTATFVDNRFTFNFYLPFNVMEIYFPYYNLNFVVIWST